MVTLTLGANDYEAFSSVEDADQYLAGDVQRAAGWALRDDAAKKRGLISATRMLLTLPWVLAVPDPAVVQDAPLPEITAQLAADLLTSPKLFSDASGQSNIKSVKAGSAQVDFFSPVRGGPPIPLALWRRLLAAGLVTTGLDGVMLNEGPFVSGISDGCRPLYGRPPWDWPVAAEDYD